jgi:hypothetical protein
MNIRFGVPGNRQRYSGVLGEIKELLVNYVRIDEVKKCRPKSMFEKLW